MAHRCCNTISTPFAVNTSFGGVGMVMMRRVLSKIHDSLHSLLGEEPGVVLRGVSAYHGSLFTDDEGGGLFRAAVFWSYEQRLHHVVPSCLDDDADAAPASRVSRSTPFPGLSQCVMQVVFGTNNDVACRLCLAAWGDGE